MASPAAAAARKPKVTTIPVGLGPVRVATNPQTNTIYVTDSAAQTVSVIDGATNTVTATILGIFNPAGVATDPQTNTVYVANIGSSSVSVVRT